VLRDTRGFTLAELLVVMAVTGLVMAGAFALQHQGTQSYLTGAARVEVQQNARTVLERMVSELRSAQSVTTLGGPADVTFVDENGNTVRYQLSGNMLNRTEGGAPAPLAGGVQALTLTYYSAPGTVTAAPGSVRMIRIQIITGTERPASAGSPGDQRATVESTVTLRNA
jgi:prepilin-type N-terminal cleavage/methylation domain-containing protein